MVESAQNPPNTGCHDPRLQPIKHDLLNHRQVNMDGGPGICTLPSQHPSQPLPLLPFSPKFVDHLWPVIVLSQENSHKILEGGDQGEGGTIGYDRQLCPRMCLLLCQATPLTFFSTSEKVRRKMSTVEWILRHKHDTLGAPGVNSVTLLQDHDCVPCVEVRKVNPGVGPI